jgi:uncharacterized membrane protein
MKIKISKPIIMIISLAFIAAILGVYKFSSCASNGWATPEQFIHACYSDIPSLYSARSLDKNQWSYSSKNEAVEYPVITGTVMWLIAKATPFGDNNLLVNYKINIALLAALYILIALIVQRIRPQFAYLAAIAPAGIASMYINWDLWAILSMMLSIYWFDKRRYKHSAVAIGISISTKFLPVFLLLPIILILWRRKEVKESIKYIIVTLITFAAINLPVFLTTPEGWLRFYKLNIERGQDWGSLWYASTSLGIKMGNANLLAILALLVTFIIVTILISKTKAIPSLADVSFIVLALVMISSKVYSPQYVLWLVPLAVIAISTCKELNAFWVWQTAEVLYHIAIWQHLAVVTGAEYGMSLSGYSVITLIRIIATAYLTIIFIKNKGSGRDTKKFLVENQNNEVFDLTLPKLDKK